MNVHETLWNSCVGQTVNPHLFCLDFCLLVFFLKHYEIGIRKESTNEH